MKWTPLMLFYALFALAGLLVPWYCNIRFMMASGELLTPQRFVAGGFETWLTASIMTDFMIGTIPVLVWMIVEARRLHMPHLWAYVAFTFLIAFAFTCPLFLLMREVRLQSLRNEGAA
jgi:hypothetical protein